MSTYLSTKELRTMKIGDLREEIAEKKMELSKLRLSASVGKEKDTSVLKKGRKELARMSTILTEKMKGELPKSEETPTVSAPKKSSKKTK